MKIITSAKAAAMILSNSTLCSQGMNGNAVAEELLLELEKRFLATGQPRILNGFTPPGRETRAIAA